MALQTAARRWFCHPGLHAQRRERRNGASDFHWGCWESLLPWGLDPDYALLLADMDVTRVWCLSLGRSFHPVGECCTVPSQAPHKSVLLQVLLGG